MKYFLLTLFCSFSILIFSQVNIGYGYATNNKYLKPVKASFVESNVEWIVDDNCEKMYCRFSNPLYYPFKDLFWNINSVKSNSEYDVYDVSSIDNTRFFIYFYKEQHGTVIFNKSNDTFTAIIGDDLNYKIRN